MRIPPHASRRHVALRDDRSLHLDPVTVDTEDGITWDGLALIPKQGPAARRRLMVIVVHGSVGNYISGVPRRIAHALALAGFSVLSVNTRMANYGAFFGGGLFHRTPYDLDAWVDLARRMGHRRIVLAGYSMGSTMVTHYQSLRQRPEVVGLATFAHPRSLPDSLKRRWSRFGSIPGYDTVVERALALIGDSLDDDHGPDEIFIVRRANGPTDEPAHAEVWTYRTWWFSRGPHADAADSVRQIGSIRVPICLVQAEHDLMVPLSDGTELEHVALEGGVPSVDLSIVRDANHVFSGCTGQAVDRCIAWLDRTIAPSVPGESTWPELPDRDDLPPHRWPGRDTLT